MFRRGEKFDYIAFNDIDDTVDVQRALQNLKPLCERHTASHYDLQSSLGTFGYAGRMARHEGAADRAKLAFRH